VSGLEDCKNEAEVGFIQKLLSLYACTGVFEGGVLGKLGAQLNAMSQLSTKVMAS
jgi:hypothetical protein